MGYAWPIFPNFPNTSLDLCLGGVCFYTKPDFLIIGALGFGVGAISSIFSSSHDGCVRCFPNKASLVSKIIFMIGTQAGFEPIGCHRFSKVGVIASLVLAVSSLIFKSNLSFFLVSIKAGVTLGRCLPGAMLVLHG